jgi:Dehydrogenases with different specificities (related to short-chain alcohol dehydrogenases)
MTTKVAVVTASDSGIGKQCAIQLARKGFSLGVTWHSDEEGARQTVQELTSLGCQAQAIQLDLSHLPQGAEALDVLIQRLGRIDVLVQQRRAHDESLRSWTLRWMTGGKRFVWTWKATLLCSQIAARHMIAQGEGGNHQHHLGS